MHQYSYKAHADINRIKNPTGVASSGTKSTSLDSRILVLSVSPDIPSSYIPIMNSIFSAQKLVGLPHTLIMTLLDGDCGTCLESKDRRMQSVWRRHSIPSASLAFDRRVIRCARTAGGAPAVPHRKSILLVCFSVTHCILQMCFLPGNAIRQTLLLPNQDRVDLRAACFCHKDIVDIGYVCSVCLSSERCTTPTVGIIF